VTSAVSLKPDVGSLISVELGYTWEPGKPNQYANHQWAGFGVILLVNLIGLIVIVVRKDIVWCIAAVWIDIAIWSAKPKPSAVFIIAIAFTAIHPIALVFAATWKKLKGKDEGRIRLPPNDNAESDGRPHRQQQARELKGEGLRDPQIFDSIFTQHKSRDNLAGSASPPSHNLMFSYFRRSASSDSRCSLLPWEHVTCASISSPIFMYFACILPFFGSK
jgi:hypothetical protein